LEDAQLGNTDPEDVEDEEYIDDEPDDAEPEDTDGEHGSSTPPPDDAAELEDAQLGNTDLEDIGDTDLEDVDAEPEDGSSRAAKLARAKKLAQERERENTRTSAKKLRTGETATSPGAADEHVVLDSEQQLTLDDTTAVEGLGDKGNVTPLPEVHREPVLGRLDWGVTYSDPTEAAASKSSASLAPMAVQPAKQLFPQPLPRATPREEAARKRRGKEPAVTVFPNVAQEPLDQLREGESSTTIPHHETDAHEPSDAGAIVTGDPEDVDDEPEDTDPEDVDDEPADTDPENRGDEPADTDSEDVDDEPEDTELVRNP
jgi:hypothetical protein